MIKMNKSVRFSTMLAGFIVTTCLCQKIDAAEMYEQLSLNDAIGIALKNNVEQRISLQAAAVAESQYQEAVSAHWPTVSLQASMTRMDEDPTFSLPGATVSIASLAAPLNGALFGGGACDSINHQFWRTKSQADGP